MYLEDDGLPMVVMPSHDPPYTSLSLEDDTHDVVTKGDDTHDVVTKTIHLDQRRASGAYREPGNHIQSDPGVLKYLQGGNPVTRHSTLSPGTRLPTPAQEWCLGYQP